MVYWRILLASLLLVHEWYDLIIAFEGGDGKGGGCPWDAKCKAHISVAALLLHKKRSRR